MEFNKEEFLKEFGGDYGYPDGPKSIEEIRNSEFKRLNGLVYLDHAGSTLYSESQMEAIFKDLTSNVYGNPHTQSDSGAATSDMLRAARQQVLDYCNASPKEYTCIFTSGTTAALKMVGEYFPWSRESCYMYTMENHNSVLGIREYALNHGAAAIPVDIEMAEEHDCSFNHGSSSIKITQHPVLRRSVPGEVLNGNPSGSIYNLFAFPSECNFSGIKFDLNLVNAIKEHAGSVLEGSSYRMGRWMVLIDAAKGGGTQPPDLARFPADFVVMSFYKIFGYPTGLGALVVRTEVTNLLKKTYFSGGTVAASVADIDYVRRRAGAEDWFEDGTPSFLSIASIHHGFKIIDTLSISSIARHTRSLATYVRRILLALRHENGAAVCVLYGRGFGKASSDDMGPTIAFNLKRPDGSWFGYREVEKLASLCGIQLRTGCFCNPGACAKYLGLSHSDLLSNIEAGRVCWDDNDILHGKPTGAVRISFGYMSSFEDAKKFISFIVSSFVSNQNPSGQGYLQRTKTTPLPNEGTGMGEVYLKSIIVYPIKSCAGFSVDSWPISNNGLQHDREWLLRSPIGQVLTQKKVPEMSLISTSVNLTWGTLIVESPICNEKLQICLEWNSCCDVKEEIELNGQRYEVQGYNSEVNLWFTKAVARPCVLLRCLRPASRPCVNKTGREAMCRDVQSKLNFVNEAQILLISEESVADLNQKLSSNTQERNDGLKKIHHVSPMRFRPNLVISGAEPYAEDYWKSLVIGNGHFTSLGGCNRCQMINLDTMSGRIQKSTEPLLTLASYRRVQGRILFGILLKYERTLSECKEKAKSAGSRLQVRQRVIPEI